MQRRRYGLDGNPKYVVPGSCIVQTTKKRMCLQRKCDHVTKPHVTASVTSQSVRDGLICFHGRESGEMKEARTPVLSEDLRWGQQQLDWDSDRLCNRGTKAGQMARGFCSVMKSPQRCDAILDYTLN
ncbi:hypothetical protein NDU88_002031 [Pleurodeles waltl]|uniref:Uncharacterized protein n=1 Tax=Pleurodeles waltl TaxID=8319 RepID=A0AAV7TJI4_PLEWA|nr:hypothetical protein NDU88_002031 [Pleurodeles waltl]